MNLQDATAPRPLWSVVNATLSLDYPFIRLVDEEVDDLKAMQAGEGIDEQHWVVKGKGWISLLSGGTGHTPVVTMEAWETVPPPDDNEWERERDLVVKFPSGTLRLSGGTDGSTEGPLMAVPDSGDERYNVRIQMRSAEPGKTADELYAEYLEADTEGDEFLYVEFWRLQFWPAE